jgi:hypothetical protein
VVSAVDAVTRYLTGLVGRGSDVEEPYLSA